MKLYHGDCLEVMKEISDKSVDCIITDPPYLHESGGRGKFLLGDSLDREKYNMGELSDFGKDQIYNFLNASKRINKKKQWYIFCSEKQVVYYLSWCIENNLKYNLLTWNKPLSVLNTERFSTNMEYIVRIYDNGCKLNKLSDDKLNYYSKYKVCNQLRGKNKIHGSQKPIEIVEQFIELSTNKGDIILDCFMGSGTTGVACYNTKRHFIGIEKDDNYFKLAKERIDNAMAQLKLF